MAKLKYPCRNCAYKAACGNTNRTQPCAGRITPNEQRKALQKFKESFEKGARVV